MSFSVDRGPGRHPRDFAVGALAILFVVAGCATHGNAPANDRGAPVSDQGKPLRQPESEYREVIAGDTLYSIAWESGRDHRELASWNGIAPPYTIRVGQKIRLFPPANTTTTGKAADPTTHTVQKGDTLFSIATRYDVSVAEMSSWNALPAPYTLKPGQTLRVSASAERVAKQDSKHDEKKPPATAPRKKDATTVASTSRTPVPVASHPKTANASFGPWTWPTDGAPGTRTAAGNSKGIDITGKSGQTIVAAAPGTVVYQGSGLRGYGQLIIIKHDAEFLSAYAHCDKIVVREGNVIKRGQKIAEMGSTGTDRVKLHFEIRYRGTPVDPIDFLPKK